MERIGHGGIIMYDFHYVAKSELKPFEKELIELIHSVRYEVRSKFNFQHQFVGSVKRNMVTYDPKSNIGFDFDINLEVNDDKNYSPSEIRHILMNAFNKYTSQYGYDCCEDGTRVFTIKVKDIKRSRILHSCDFAIVRCCGESRQRWQYIRFNKSTGKYFWANQSEGFYRLPKKIEFCKENGLWPDVRNLYLDKKRRNKDTNKKSRQIFAETMHQICQNNGFYKR